MGEGFAWQNQFLKSAVAGAWGIDTAKGIDAGLESMIILGRQVPESVGAHPPQSIIEIPPEGRLYRKLIAVCLLSGLKSAISSKKRLNAALQKG